MAKWKSPYPKVNPSGKYLLNGSTWNQVADQLGGLGYDLSQDAPYITPTATIVDVIRETTDDTDIYEPVRIVQPVTDTPTPEQEEAYKQQNCFVCEPPVENNPNEDVLAILQNGLKGENANGSVQAVVCGVSTTYIKRATGETGDENNASFKYAKINSDGRFEQTKTPTVTRIIDRTPGSDYTLSKVFHCSSAPGEADDCEICDPERETGIYIHWCCSSLLLKPDDGSGPNRWSALIELCGECDGSGSTYLQQVPPGQQIGRGQNQSNFVPTHYMTAELEIICDALDDDELEVVLTTFCNGQEVESISKTIEGWDCNESACQQLDYKLKNYKVNPTPDGDSGNYVDRPFSLVICSENSSYRNPCLAINNDFWVNDFCETTDDCKTQSIRIPKVGRCLWVRQLLVPEDCCNCDNEDAKYRDGAAFIAFVVSCDGGVLTFSIEKFCIEDSSGDYEQVAMDSYTFPANGWYRCADITLKDVNCGGVNTVFQLCSFNKNNPLGLERVLPVILDETPSKPGNDGQPIGVTYEGISGEMLDTECLIYACKGDPVLAKTSDFCEWESAAEHRIKGVAFKLIDEAKTALGANGFDFVAGKTQKLINRGNNTVKAGEIVMAHIENCGPEPGGKCEWQFTCCGGDGDGDGPGGDCCCPYDPPYACINGETKVLPASWDVTGCCDKCTSAFLLIEVESTVNGGQPSTVTHRFIASFFCISANGDTEADLDILLGEETVLCDEGGGTPGPANPIPIQKYLGRYDADSVPTDPNFPVYGRGDVVVDGEWTMIARTATDERPAPLPNGTPVWVSGEGDSPAWTSSTQTDSIHIFGQRYTFEQSKFYSGYRFWLPSAAVGFDYELWLVADPEDGDIPNYENILPRATATANDVDQWIAFPQGSRPLRRNSVVDFAIVMYSTTGQTNWGADWDYKRQNGNPSSGEVNHQSAGGGYEMRISNTDKDDNDETTRLRALNVGDLISAGGTVWTIVEIIDNTAGGYTSFGVDPSTRITENLYTFTFTTYADLPIPFVEIPGHWTVAPTSADGVVVQGFRTNNYAGGVTLTDTLYGIDITLQDAIISNDWDYFSYGGT